MIGNDTVTLFDSLMADFFLCASFSVSAIGVWHLKHYDRSNKNIKGKD